MRLLRYTLLMLAAILGAAPAEAGPRVTLQLERASLHEVLMQLNQLTGLRLTGPGGAGRATYKDPPAARRTRIDYRDAPVGKVLRELAASHDLIPQAAGGYVGFIPRAGFAGPREVPGGPGSRIALSFHRLSQSEYREIVPGAGPVSEARNLDLRLCLRSLDGDGDAFGEVRKLRLVDEKGQVSEVAADTYSQELGRGLPDERFLDLSIPWKGPLPTRLSKVEGSVEVSTGLTERKVTIPVPSGGAQAIPTSGIETVMGPFRVKLLRLTTQNAVTARVRIDWSTGQTVAFNDQGMVRAVMVLADGQNVPMAGQARRGKNDPAQVAGDFYAPVLGQPVAIEVMIPTRGPGVREEAFSMTGITLPFGLPYGLRTQPLHEPLRPLSIIRYRPPSPVPPIFQQVGGGVLRIKVPPSPVRASSELMLGIQRQGSGGTWGSLHWIALESTAPDLLLENLAEGTYRFTLRLTASGPGEASSVPPAVWKSLPLSIRKGRTSELAFPGQAPRN